ncbi:zinc metalloproteinase nas-13-like [Saccostrea cucullata]|uniref:zinc metalloproteinase nas-13-like n=1 Tax=Saccostrea cuccullata TaxID=36930 RepID=UPI002ED2422B
MKFLGIFIATCLFLMADAMEEKSIDELMMDSCNDSLSFDLMSSGSAENLFSNENPIVRVEYDILMTLDDYIQQNKERMAQDKMGSRKKRKAARDERRRWTNKIVPYEIAPNTFSQAELDQINLAIGDWNRETCVVFRPRREESRAVRFQNGDGCSSFVGMAGNVQPISLARGCRIRRIVIHEIGHAVGFQHEQSRSDRDGFVRIIEANIPQAVLFNFESLPTNQVNNFGVPYDYRSVMHYGARAFSTNGGITVRTLDSSFQDIIGRAPGLSFRDIKLANLMYNCAENCPAKSCPGEGFVGKDCSCKCPTNNPSSPVQNCEGTALVTTTSVPTIRTISPTTTPRVGCRDQHRYCRFWASTGECTSRRGSGFMALYCKNACGLCNVENTCQDFGRSCDFWARMGYCQMTFVSYMSRNCRATCNFCRAGELLNPDGTPLNSKASNLGSTNMLIMILAFIVWSLL